MRLAVLAVVLLGCSKSEPPSALSLAAAACARGDDVGCAIPILNVADLRASQRYFRDALGFKLEWEDGNPPDFASVSRGEGRLFMCEGCQGNPGTWVMLFTKDVDKLHDELVRRKATIRMRPKDMPWGLREMHVSDVDGNVLRFGSPLRH